MKLVDEGDIKKNKLYLMYYVSKERKRTMYFFKYREAVGEHKSIFRGLQYAILARGNNFVVFDKFWKTDALLPLTTEDGTATIFEIGFDEFAHHVVSEII